VWIRIGEIGRDVNNTGSSPVIPIDTGGPSFRLNIFGLVQVFANIVTYIFTTEDTENTERTYIKCLKI